MEKWIKLRSGKEKKLRNFYPFIFRDEILEIGPTVEDGDIVLALDNKARFVAIGTYSSCSHIAFRSFSLQEEVIDKNFFAKRIEAALQLRQSLSSQTNAYRLVHAEADFLPGLLVDKYGDILVVQVRSKGMERLQSQWLEPLIEIIKPLGVYERSDMESRAEEGLRPIHRVLYGQIPELIEIEENGLRFLVDIRKGLKTGYYLDQRDNRALIRALIKPGQSLLDLFAYTGAFSIYGASAGAIAVAIEQYPYMVEIGKMQAKLNDVDVKFLCGNVFELLPTLQAHGNEFDFIIIDPPAIAKGKGKVASLKKMIYKICYETLPILRPRGKMLICSCAYHMGWDQLIEAIRFAANERQLPLRILKQCTQPIDHPVRIHIPESHYLRCLLVERD